MWRAQEDPMHTIHGFQLVMATDVYVSAAMTYYMILEQCLSPVHTVHVI